MTLMDDTHLMSEIGQRRARSWVTLEEQHQSTAVFITNHCQGRNTSHREAKPREVSGVI
jgi:hypothetical protein